MIIYSTALAYKLVTQLLMILPAFYRNQSLINVFTKITTFAHPKLHECRSHTVSWRYNLILPTYLYL